MESALGRSDDLEAAADKAGLRSTLLGRIDGEALVAWQNVPRLDTPTIYLSAGIHGDEPAGTLALLELVEEGFFDHRAAWQICPALNPVGLRRSRRENAAGIDLNRDYRHTRSREIALHRAWLDGQPSPDLAICLHEDWETSGFYLYMQGDASAERLALDMLQAVAATGPIEPRDEIDGFPIADGLIKPRETRPISEMEEWPEAVYLYERRPCPQYTLETPSSAALSQRVAMHKVALERAVERFGLRRIE